MLVVGELYELPGQVVDDDAHLQDGDSCADLVSE